MKYIIIGKYVNTHGIKGEIRISSNFKYKNRIFKKDFKLYLGKDKDMFTITSYRVHKNFDMVCFRDINNINQILKYKGSLVYINKDDLVLKEKEYLDEDLIGLKVKCHNVYYGEIVNIKINNVNDLLVIRNNNQEYLLPYNRDLIKDISFDNKEIIFREDIEGLMQ